MRHSSFLFNPRIIHFSVHSLQKTNDSIAIILPFTYFFGCFSPKQMLLQLLGAALISRLINLHNTIQFLIHILPTIQEPLNSISTRSKMKQMLEKVTLYVLLFLPTNQIMCRNLQPPQNVAKHLPTLLLLPYQIDLGSLQSEIVLEKLQGSIKTLI